MANMVIGNLKVTSGKSIESTRSLLDFESKGMNIRVLNSEKDWYWNESEKMELDGKEHSYIVESLNMGRFIPTPEWMDKFRGVSHGDENYNEYIEWNQKNKEKIDTWYEENYGGPGYLFDSFIDGKKIDVSESEDSWISYCYETKWIPNIQFIKNVSELYPSLTFKYEFHEDMGKFFGHVIYKNGECLDEKITQEGEEDDPYTETFLDFESESDYNTFLEEIDSGKSKYIVEKDFNFPNWSQLEPQNDMKYLVFYSDVNNEIYSIKRSYILDNPKRIVNESYFEGSFHEQHVHEIVS